LFLTKELDMIQSVVEQASLPVFWTGRDAYPTISEKY